MNSKSNLLPSTVEAIGQTPLVALDRITRGIDGRILAKLECLNPGYSKKDRIARQIIEDAEANNELTPGQTVVEMTSGNTGTGLAIVCGVKGYKFVAVMSKGNSIERARMMRALGAEVILVDQLPDSLPGEVTRDDLEQVDLAAQRITIQRGAFRADQFKRQGNFRAHLLHTGPEIWEQSSGNVTAFCDFVGSGGTLAGCAAAFKERNAGVKCFAVEPEGAAVLAGEKATNLHHPIQGGGYAIPDLGMINRDHLDGYLTVTGEEATAAARRLASEEGIFGGYSSGANLAAALKLLDGECAGGTIAIVICDSGLKYLSTDLWPE